ncbi:hypothetical protein HK097_010981 [Rhizophlyctis rosea]|uniref:Cyclic nucleotide-binding domain-containing protein n=1 Tax=Rhizophlyctis rosea TaxID=64517 RepID=A0AAD5WZG3_9FUNG|nr:hypothetical protein HK097_010981 [Rhizophlyctis rosea]
MDESTLRILDKLRTIENAISAQETTLASLRYSVGEVIADCGALAAAPVKSTSVGKIVLPPLEHPQPSLPPIDTIPRIHEPQPPSADIVDEEAGQASGIATPTMSKKSVVKPPAHMFNSPIRTAQFTSDSGEEGDITPLQKAKIRAAAAAAAAADQKLHAKHPSPNQNLISVQSRPKFLKRIYRHYFLQPLGTQQPRAIGLSVLDLSQRHHPISAYMVHPHSIFCHLWNATTTMLLCIAFVTFPLFIGFEEIAHGLQALSIITTIFYTLNIFIRLRTGYFEDSHVVMDSSLSSRRYFKRGTFWFDLITAIPWIFIVDASTGSNVVNEAKWRTVFGAIVAYWHWSACIENWIDVIEQSHHLHDYSSFARYTIGVFNSASEMFSAGYEEELVVKKDTNVKRWLKIMNILIGAIFEATLVGHISTFLISLDSSGRMFQEKMDEVNQYIAYKNLDQSLRKRILSYYEFKYSNNKYFHESSILKELNEPLRQAVCIHNCRSFLLKVPFFRDSDNAFINQLVTSLTINHYLPGDIVIAEDTSGDDMHFIASGICEVITQGTVRARLTPGLFFGEISLLFGEMKRTATVRVVTPCVLYSLRKKNLDEVLEHHPIMAHRIRKVASDRLSAQKAMRKLDLRRKSTTSPPTSASTQDPTTIYDAGEKVLLSPSTSDDRLNDRLSVSSQARSRE